ELRKNGFRPSEHLRLRVVFRSQAPRTFPFGASSHVPRKLRTLRFEPNLILAGQISLSAGFDSTDEARSDYGNSCDSAGNRRTAACTSPARFVALSLRLRWEQVLTTVL